MLLFGSPTSPFVRRLRVYCAELGLPYTAVDVFTDAGQARLRATTPLWKVPTVVYEDGAVQWDSAAILGHLIARHGSGPFAAETGDPATSNRTHATLGALESAIAVFYLRRDGVDIGAIPYMVKQEARVDAALDWLAGELRGPVFRSFRADGGFGMAELTLFCVLDWMRFRSVRPVASVPAFAAFLAAHEGRPSLVATHPSQPFVDLSGG
jgi:glutathione S-transferase